MQQLRSIGDGDDVTGSKFHVSAAFLFGNTDTSYMFSFLMPEPATTPSSEQSYYTPSSGISYPRGASTTYMLPVCNISFFFPGVCF